MLHLSVGRRRGHHRADRGTAIEEMQERMVVQLDDVRRAAVQVVWQQPTRQLLRPGRQGCGH